VQSKYYIIIYHIIILIFRNLKYILKCRVTFKIILKKTPQTKYSVEMGMQNLDSRQNIRKCDWNWKDCQCKFSCL